MDKGRIRSGILRALKTQETVSGEELASSMGVSRTAVWKQINTLRQDGYVIDASPRSGYRLRTTPDRLYPAEIQAGLQTGLIGNAVHYYSETSSTNDVGRRLASEGCEDGTLVVAERQSTGRGRLKRSWISPEGGLWFSVVLRPEITPSRAPLATLMGGVAVARAIQKHTDLRAGIKWPNDILIDERKVCGILTEISAEMDRVNYIVVGIGLNANVDLDTFPDEIRRNTTSLSHELGEDIDRVKLLQTILEEMDEQYSLLRKQDFEKILQEWRNLSGTLGRRVRIITQEGDVDGDAVDVSSNGALLLRLDNGSVREFVAGDCIHMGNV